MDARDAFKYVEIASEPGGIAVLRIARPEFMNALHLAAVQEIRGALRRIADDDTVKVLVLTGKGRGFCAGADLSAMASDGITAEDQAATAADSMTTDWNPMMACIRAFPKPTIAVVHGPAAGAGVGLALATDVTIAARSAYFVLTFTPTLGLTPDLGVTWQLNRRIGRGRALPLALLGDRLYADEAQRCDLIWEACDDQVLWSRGLELAARLAALPPQAVRLVRDAIDASTSNTFEVQLKMERDVQMRLFKDPDANNIRQATTKRFAEAAERRGRVAKL